LKIHFAVAASIVALAVNFCYYRIVIADTVNSAMPRKKEETKEFFAPPILRLPSWMNSQSLLNYLETAAGVLSMPRVRFTRTFDGRRGKEGNRGKEERKRETTDPLTIHYWHRRHEGSTDTINRVSIVRCRGWRRPRLGDITTWIIRRTLQYDCDYATQCALGTSGDGGTGGSNQTSRLGIDRSMALAYFGNGV